MLDVLHICLQLRARYDSMLANDKYTMTKELDNENVGYQIIVCNIHWNTMHAPRKVNVDELPMQLALDVPENVMNQAKKKGNVFNDIIEQFAYNLLTRKFNCEVCSCQIWLP